MAPPCGTLVREAYPPSRPYPAEDHDNIKTKGQHRPTKLCMGTLCRLEKGEESEQRETARLSILEPGAGIPARKSSRREHRPFPSTNSPLTRAKRPAEAAQSQRLRGRL